MGNLNENQKRELADSLTGLNDSFTALKGSEIVDDEYYINTGNLIGCIDIIADSIRQILEYVDKDSERGDYRSLERRTNEIREHTFKMITLTDMIKERVNDSDYTELDNLFYHYKKIQEVIPDSILMVE